MHQTVLRAEAVELLSPATRQILVDCTIGEGGHAEALLSAAPQQAVLIGLDVDEANLRACKQRLSAFGRRVRLFQANFRDLDAVLAEAGVGAADAIIADLGVSSGQLDDPSRGLSFLEDGPLDMRLGRQGESTARDMVNFLDQRSLADLIYRNSQERYSRRIAKAIVEARTSGRIERTRQLADIVSSAYPAAARRGRRGVHPATRTFLALRIAVNDELGCLDRLLELLPAALSPGGRAGIISFHSLEDKRVKNAFAALQKAGSVRLLTKKPIAPGAEEMELNPRSRSAKLRVIEKIE